MPAQRIQLLEKLVQIYSWHPDCCYRIRDLIIQAPLEFCEKFSQIEHWLKVSKPDNPQETARQALDDTCYWLYEVILCSDPIRELILSEPSLSQANVDQVVDYASIADVSPDPNPAVMLKSRDVLFMRLLGRILKQFPSTPDDIFRENLASLIALQKEYPVIFEQLDLLAENFLWSESLHKIGDYFKTEPPPTDNATDLPQPALTIIEMISVYEKKEKDESEAAAGQANSSQSASPVQRPPKPTIREFLFGELEITTIQREELILFRQVGTKLTTIEDTLQQENWKDFTARQKGEAIAKKLLEQHLVPEEAARPIKDRIFRRMEAARHYVELREYVKFNTLNQAWPELSTELINNRARFLAFESRMLDPETLAKEATGTGELSRLLQRYMDNDQLLHFLQLRPYFSGLSVKKAQEIFSLTSSMPQSEAGKTEPVTAPQQIPAPQPGWEAAPIPPVATAPEVFANLHISIKGQPILEQNEEKLQCQVSARSTDLSEVLEIPPYNVRKQDVDLIKHNAYNLMRIAYEQKSEVRSPAQEVEYRRMSSSDPSRKKRLSAYLNEIGLQLNSLFFPDPVAGYMVKALKAFPKIRFVLDIQLPELWSLPWEALYISELKLPVALVSKHSLVRYFPASNTVLAQPWGTKIRILALFAGPTNLPRLNLEDEEKVLAQVFADTDRVEFMALSHATIDQLSTQIRRFQPHVIHFSGHGGQLPNSSEGELFFEREDGSMHPVHASQFSTWCRDQNVSMVVLNACDTGTPVANDAVSSVAGALVDAGIPATVATTRPITEIQSIIFVRELYRAILDGYPVEAAMAEARKRVNSEDWDWSAFALFASTLDLERYKLIVERK